MNKNTIASQSRTILVAGSTYASVNYCYHADKSKADIFQKGP
jgi:hypothetical protein